MDSNCMEIIRLIVDIIARIFVPLFVPFILYFLSKKPVKKIINLKRENVEKVLREHIRNCAIKEQASMKKIIDEVFSKSDLHW